MNTCDQKSSSDANNKNKSPHNSEKLKPFVTWRTSDWEQHLASLDTYQREEYLHDFDLIETLSNDDYANAFINIFQLNEYPHLRTKIRKILRSLNARQREVIKLRYWNNLSLTEIAKSIGVSHTAISKTLNQAHRLIQEKLLATIGKNSSLN